MCEHSCGATRFRSRQAAMYHLPCKLIIQRKRYLWIGQHKIKWTKSQILQRPLVRARWMCACMNLSTCLRLRKGMYWALSVHCLNSMIVCASAVVYCCVWLCSLVIYIYKNKLFRIVDLLYKSHKRPFRFVCYLPPAPQHVVTTTQSLEV